MWCQFDLSAVDRPVPSDRIEHSLMSDSVSVLGPRVPVTVSDTADIGIAVRSMIDRQVGAVLVTDASGRLVGILTERDFLTKVAGSADFASRPVAAFMTRHPETVRLADPLAFALGKMAGGGYRHLPVVADGKPVGVVSVRDILRYIVGLCREG
ncbi:cyclic nucleotide-binding/CBS domain-containing protein [Fimbriiglobus ruber]|uniref:CBS domain-containing protein n=1 Tax=Fimbriiglobus ruber TaxID=1908690 RepID=UPI00137B7937|nr:CBS domain-containing protein [Fimbriiglobus ruber]